MAMAMASSSSSSSSVVLLLTLMLLGLGLASTSYTLQAWAKKTVVLTYYTQQQFGVNEFGMVAAAVAPVNGTRQGVGLEVVYDYTITAGGSPTSAAIGFVRGTSVVVSNTANATIFFVKTVVDIADPVSGLSGTFSTQGEANFGSGQPFELAVVGGTGNFRGVIGYAIASSFNFTPPTATSTAKITNLYKAYLTFLL